MLVSSLQHNNVFVFAGLHMDLVSFEHFRSQIAFSWVSHDTVDITGPSPAERQRQH